MGEKNGESFFDVFLLNWPINEQSFHYSSFSKKSVKLSFSNFSGFWAQVVPLWRHAYLHRTFYAFMCWRLSLFAVFFRRFCGLWGYTKLGIHGLVTFVNALIWGFHRASLFFTISIFVVFWRYLIAINEGHTYIIVAYLLSEHRFLTGGP